MVELVVTADFYGAMFNSNIAQKNLPSFTRRTGSSPVRGTTIKLLTRLVKYDTMATVVQWLESRVVIPLVVGSNPTGRPNKL